jgi:hypothetical protein
MKTLWIPLVAVGVLLAASTASADWVYTPGMGWTYVTPVYPAPAISYPLPPPPVYVYRPPVVGVPTVITPVPVIRTAPVVVHSRMVVRRRAVRRSVWTVW